MAYHRFSYVLYYLDTDFIMPEDPFGFGPHPPFMDPMTMGHRRLLGFRKEIAQLDETKSQFALHHSIYVGKLVSYFSNRPILADSCILIVTCGTCDLENECGPSVVESITHPVHIKETPLSPDNEKPTDSR